MFQITDDVAALTALLDRLEAEEAAGLGTSEATVQLLSDYLDESEGRLREKVDGYVSFYRHLQARAKARREEARHIAELARYDEARMQRLKDAVQLVAEKLGRKKLEGVTRSISVSRSKRPSVTVMDAYAVPNQFVEQEVRIKVDKKALVEHIMATGEVPAGTQIRAVVSVRFR
jgi:hypothetical protein